MGGKIRLYVDADLAPGQPVALSREQAHYLGAVMRQNRGATVYLFNGRDGEWAATLDELGKRAAVAVCVALTQPLESRADLWLLFAPVKKARTDFIVEKATEMGASRIVPVITEFTNAERVRRERLQAHAAEAAEQCGGTFVPEVTEAMRLDRLLATWESSRKIMFCDEALAGGAVRLPQSENAGAWAVLIGPEGGFSDRERQTLAARPDAHAVALGPRILRADTAAVAALTLWQMTYGGW